MCELDWTDPILATALRFSIDESERPNYNPPMIHRIRSIIIAAAVGFCVCSPLFSQSAWSGPKLIGIVPLTGKGTWEDPRRPDLPKEMSGNFHWLPSDDGRWAIVEIGEGTGSEAMVQEVRRLAKEGSANGIRLFRPGIHAKELVEAEIRRLRSSFSMDDLSAAARAVARRPQ